MRRLRELLRLKENDTKSIEDRSIASQSLSFAQKIRDIRVQSTRDSAQRFRDAIVSRTDANKISRETRKDVVAIATKLLTTRQFSVVDSLILLIQGLPSAVHATQELCEDRRFSRALFVFALEETKCTTPTSTNFLKLISILALHQSSRVAHLISETDGLLASLILSTSKCSSEAYEVLNSIDSNEFWSNNNNECSLLDLIKGLISISTVDLSSVIGIKCHALLQRGIMSIVSGNDSTSIGNGRTNEWKDVLDAASHVFRKNPNSSPWFTMLLCFIASSHQLMIMVSDLKLHLILRATYVLMFSRSSVQFVQFEQLVHIHKVLGI